MNRARLSRPAKFSGIGIHSGKTCNVTVAPPAFGSGIFFKLQGSGKTVSILASAQNAVSQARATRLESNGVAILTPEHLLAALFGLGISDAEIIVDAPEIPIMDGSARPFAEGFQSVGIEQSTIPWETISVKSPLQISDGDKLVVALPDSGLKFSTIIEYDNFIGCQSVTWTYNPDTFATEIAPARTYGFKHEIDQLLAAGLGKGGSLDNALVIDTDRYISSLRFSDELARHKLLDLIGDLSLTGAHLQGHFVGIRSGHTLNGKMAAALSQNSKTL